MSLGTLCLLSPLLYILCAEVFALSIRADNEIKGIQIDDKVRHKISQYADDTTLTVVGDESIDSLFPRCHLHKCKGLMIGRNKNRTYKPQGIKWHMDKIKIIGFYLGNENIKR